MGVEEGALHRPLPDDGGRTEHLGGVGEWELRKEPSTACFSMTLVARSTCGGVGVDEGALHRPLSDDGGRTEHLGGSWGVGVAR